MGQTISLRNGFSLPTSDEWYNEGSDSNPSNSTTIYNPTYRTTDLLDETNFGFFDDLERYGPIGRQPIPPTEMNVFSNSNDEGEIEFVTDMVEEMTKDDDLPDDFIEALNFNLVIPRANIPLHQESSGWFSDNRESL